MAENAKTALVLSPGGMFGAYQAGVWAVLSRRLQPDYIVGVSVGALNGWTIAGGVSPEELRSLWLDPATAGMLQMRERPNLLRGGYFEPAPLLRRAERLYQSYHPTIPFGLIVVHVPSFRTELVTAEHVTPLHLLATCSIPLFFPTVRIGHKTYTDGGLLQNLPLWAGAEMGATRIIAVDSLPAVFPRWLGIPMSSLKLVRRPKPVPPGVEVTVIRPSEYLGNARDAVTWDKDRIERWIALGARDAEQQIALQ